MILCKSIHSSGLFKFEFSVNRCIFNLEKMSLSGDAISHAILPGAAAGFMFSGLSVTAMTIGGMLAGIIVITMSSIFSRVSKSSEESNLAVFYLLSLALGVLIVSLNGSNRDLQHFYLVRYLL